MIVWQDFGAKKGKFPILRSTFSEKFNAISFIAII
ncbi:MAG: hypothetical protein RI894_34 [Bacteroidota bacterium]|jgi:hypothetical protein